MLIALPLLQGALINSVTKSELFDTTISLAVKQFASINQINIFASIKTLIEEDMNVLKFKKLVESAKVPNKATSGSNGFDLTATSKEWHDEFQAYVYGTGVAVEIPKGYVGLLFPRSSVRKYALAMANCVGVIDSDYRGEIMATFRPTNPYQGNVYNVGDKLCQLVVVPAPEFEIEEVDTLSDTERGTKGHGEADAHK